MGIFVILLVGFISLLATYLLNMMKRPKNYPPGPQWLPFVGNTPFIRKLARKCGGQHLAFEELFRKYKTDILGFKLGNELVIIGSSNDIVREIQQREVFTGRPDNFFLRLRTMGTRLGITCTDGEHWSVHRNFAVRHLREAGYGRQPMEVQIQKELNELLTVIDGLKGPEWPANFLPPSIINVLWMFTTGKRIERNDERLTKLLGLLRDRSKAFDMSGGTLSQIPWIRHIAPEKSGYNLLKRFNTQLHALFMETITEHHKTYTEERSGDDLIYAFIKEMRLKQDDASSSFTDMQLIMIILDIFIAGSQTTSITIDLALMMMVVRPDIQRAVQREIDANLKGAAVCVGDRFKTPYTEAVLLEVQRIFHIVPLNGPRRALHDTTLGGYSIPKNTTVLMSLRSVHMDPEIWKEPQEFRPERYLDANNKICNTDRLMPFGIGRRRCLGESLARNAIFTFFVGILQNFTLELPPNAAIPSTTLLPGITLSPKPYSVIFKRRKI